nr:PREDICTED: adenosine 3'-phospho 5'-phosphosulfate transporter 2 [Rhinolophus sinicus]
MGRGLQLRTRAGTHRRKWRFGAGKASTLREGGVRGGKCSSRRRGGEAGGDSSGPWDGETPCLAGASQAGVIFPGDTPAVEWTCRGPFSLFGTQNPSPQRNLILPVFLTHSERAWRENEVGIVSTGNFLFPRTVTGSVFSRKAHPLLLAPFPHSGWRELPRAWVSGLQAEERLTKGKETNKDNFGSTECSEIRTMDLKFNNSRKYISISVPSKTQTMSPHIKSIDDIVVLGINLSRFNKLTQFFICVAGVFVFYLIYGYLQELIFSMEGFKPYGWYLTLVQFAFYSIFGLIELQLIQDKRRRIPGKTYMIIAFLTVGTMGLSNTSLGYLNYPTQVIFKCCKLIPVMLGGVFIQGKRYNVADVSAAVCMSLGLIWFTLADSTIAPNFNLTGVILISLALCADAVIGNVQEKAMKLHNASNSEMVLYSYSIGFVYILFGLTCTNGLAPAVTFCSKNLIRTYGYAFLFSLTGYFGISFVLALIKIFGALLAVTVTTGRKAMTIVLSFIFFAKPFTFQYIWSGLLVVLGIFLNVYSKNMDKIRLPSLCDLINKTLEARKSRTLAQTV